MDIRKNDPSIFATLTTIGVIQIATLAASVARAKSTALLVGPDGVGVIGIIDQVVQVGGQGVALSLPFMATKFLSQAHSQDDEAFQRTLTRLFNLLLIVTGVGTLLLLAITVLFPSLLGDELTRYRALLLPGLLSIPAAKLHGLFVQTLTAAGRVRASALAVLAIAVLFVPSSAMGILLGGLEGMYWLNGVVSAAIVFLLIRVLRRSLGTRLELRVPDVRALLRENTGIVRWSLMIYSTSFAAPLALLVIRYTVLVHYDETTAGWLQAALAAGTLFYTILLPLNVYYLLPLVNRALPIAEKVERTTQFQHPLLLLIAAGGVPLILFGDLFVRLQYSPAFLPMTPVLFLFVMAQAGALVSGAYQSLMIGVDAMRGYVASILIGQAMYALLAWLLTPAYGLWGVGLSTLIASLFTLSFTIWTLWRQHGLTIPRYLLLLFGYTVGALAVAHIGGQFDSTQVTVFLAKAGAYVLFALTLPAFLHPAQRHRLFTVLRFRRG